MAQRQYVKIGRDLFKQKWFRKGGADARQLYIYFVDYFLASLIGIAPLDYDEIEFDLQIPPDRTKGALEYLQSVGQLRYDDKYVLILGFSEYQGFSGSKLQTAIDNETNSLGGKTTILNTLSQTENTLSDEENTPPDITLHNTTLQDSTEQDILAAPPSVPTEPKPAPKRSPKATYTEEHLDLATWVVQAIESLEKNSEYKITNPRTPNSIASGIAKSKLNAGEVKTLISWMTGNEYQRKALLNMVQFTKAIGWTTAWNKYLQQKEVKGAQDNTRGMSDDEYYRGDMPKKQPPPDYKPAPRGELHGMTDEIRESLGVKNHPISVDDHYEQQAEEERSKPCM